MRNESRTYTPRVNVFSKEPPADGKDGGLGMVVQRTEAKIRMYTPMHTKVIDQSNS